MAEPPRKRMVRPPTGGEPRAPSLRLKSAKAHSASSQAWLERQLNDPYVAEAKARGYRSRAAFKLLEIDDRLRLIRRGGRVVDLGCAPGGWIQAAQARGAGEIVGVDLLVVGALPPARILQGDFTDPAVEARLSALLGGRVDLVLSDMAPNTTGHRATDHLRIVALVEAAAEFATRTLRPGGALVAKAFQGGETAEVIGRLKRAFAEVRTLKPKASRAESSEVYLAATGFRGDAPASGSPET